MQDFISLLGLSFIGSVAGIIGGVVFLYSKRASTILSEISIPLAAGVLLAISFLDLLPEAVEHLGDFAFQIVLVVFIIAFLVEKYFFSLHHHTEDEAHGHSAVPLVIIGDTIHNFLDGLTIAVAYTVEPSFGLLVTLSTFLHETPHEIADFGILLSAGWSKRNVFWANFLSALATFPGALIGYYLSFENENASGVLLAIAAGLFLYVASTDFLPQLGKSSERSYKQAVIVIVGVLLIFVITMFVPEFGH